MPMTPYLLSGSSLYFQPETLPNLQLPGDPTDIRARPVHEPEAGNWPIVGVTARVARPLCLWSNSREYPRSGRLKRPLPTLAQPRTLLGHSIEASLAGSRTDLQSSPARW